MKLTHCVKAATLSFVMLLGSITNANALPMLSFVDSLGNSNVTIGVGESVTMDIMVSGFAVGNLLESGDITFGYDMSGAVSVAGGPVTLNPANTYEFIPFQPPADDTVNNSVNFIFAQPFFGKVPVPLGDTPFKLASVVFTGAQAGVANLIFDLATFLNDTNFTEHHQAGAPGVLAAAPLFDLTTLGASISVNAVPLPAAVWLLGSGLVGLMGFGRLRRKSANQELAAA